MPDVITGAAALARFRQKTTCPVGWCLSEVQNAWQTAHLFPDAITQWNNTIQHRSDRNPPTGAPVFYGGGRHGHIAIACEQGSGRIRSTDCPSDGSIDETDLDWPLRRWGHYYLGWGETLANQKLILTTPVVPKPVVMKTVYMHASDIYWTEAVIVNG